MDGAGLVANDDRGVSLVASVRMQLATLMVHLVSPGVQRTLAREITRRVHAEGGSQAAVNRWLPTVLGEAATHYLTSRTQQEETVLAAVRALADEHGDVREGLATLRFREVEPESSTQGNGC